MSKLIRKLTAQSVATIGYMGAAHYTAWLMDATIHGAQMRELAALTTGVVCTYPPVAVMSDTILAELGASEAERARAQVALLAGYFLAYLMAGIGTVIGRAFDRRINGKQFGVSSVADVRRLFRF